LLDRLRRSWQGDGVAANLAEDYDWVFDLLSPVPDRRRVAMSRHRGLLQEASTALARMNDIWAQAGTPAPREPHLAAASDQAQAAFDAARNGTIFGPIDRFLATRPAGRQPPDRYAPFAVLFLRWERQYPHEWAEASSWTWSHWGTKELVLRRFAGAGVPGAVGDDVIALIEAAVRGPYRCKDWRYPPLARLLDCSALREKIRPVLDNTDPLSRLRAGFLLHVLDHPELPIRRHTWHRWVADQPD
jgi:hypothetical protein